MKMNPCSLPTRRIALQTLAAIATLTVSLGLSSCSSSNSASTTPTPPTQTSNAGNFTTTVFLGDSLTAGFQSGSLLDTAEVHGWAPLVATQVNFNITQALIAYPGAPGTLLLQSVGPPPVITQASGTTTGRDNPSTQVTDLAVPGAYVNDVANTVPVASPTTDAGQITQLVLGFPGLGLGQAYSQATFAVNAKPTTIFLWIGSNDALIADFTGMPSSMTSVTDFTTQYTALMQELTTKTSAHLVIANIPDVTLVPYLTPATELLAEYSAATGYSTTTLSTLFGISAGDLVNTEGLDEISAILAGTQKSTLSDAAVLTAAEVVAVQTQVTAFNKVIAAQATAAGATLVDINALFSKIATQGLTINGYTGTGAFLGGFFSLDGIHPSNTGYAVIANTFIDTMNTAFKTSTADVNLTTVAAADPLWPPNLPKATARPGTGLNALPAAAARSLKQIMLPDRLRH